jgi:hypothetical protein
MKYKIILYIIIILPVFSQNIFSQIVGTNCFLKGNYVEIGINSCGAYGSNAAPPTGYHYNVYSGLGFTADSDLDGWTTGWPQYCGDYFVPGSPVEGWGFQLGSNKKYNTDQYCYVYDIPGSITSYSYTAGVYTAVWEGDFISGSFNFHFKQETILKENETYFVTRVTITNNGSSAVSNFYYMRNVDPDQDQPWSYDFTTYNEVISQPSTGGQALVVSEGLTYGCFLGLGSKDMDSRVTYGNFSTNTYGAKAVYDGTSGYYQSGNLTSDIANSIAFKISTLAAGESKCLAFAYVLDPADIDEALDNTLPVSFIVGGSPVSSDDTISVSPGVPVDISILGYSGYTYTWSPPSGLSSTSGETVTATTSSTVTYTITGTGDECGTLTGTVTLVPIILPVNITYFTTSCIDNVAILQWETASEINSSYFAIERSTDGIHFNEITRIPAAGFSNTASQYSYADTQAHGGTYYYRLRTVDINGQFEFSEIVSVTCNLLPDEYAILAAETQNGELTLKVKTLHEGWYLVDLSDISGQNIFHRQVLLQEGLNTLQFPNAMNTSRAYNIVIITDRENGRQAARKLIVK